MFQLFLNISTDGFCFCFSICELLYQLMKLLNNIIVYPKHNKSLISTCSNCRTHKHKCYWEKPFSKKKLISFLIEKFLSNIKKKERCSPNHETNPTETQIYFFLPKTNINRQTIHLLFAFAYFNILFVFFFHFIAHVLFVYWLSYACNIHTGITDT